MKKNGHNNDYEEEKYEVVPEWVEELMEDTMSQGLVISTKSEHGSGQWVRIDRDQAIDLEDSR